MGQDREGDRLAAGVIRMARAGQGKTTKTRRARGEKMRRTRKSDKPAAAKVVPKADLRANAARDDPEAPPQVWSSPLSLHELFEQQTRQMLERADLDEEQKQNILVSM